MNGFTREWIGGRVYLRVENDLTAKPAVLACTGAVWLQKLGALLAAAIWGYVLIYALTETGDLGGSAWDRAQCLGLVALLTLYGADKALKVWGRIGNRFLRLTALGDIAVAGLVLARYPYGSAPALGAEMMTAVVTAGLVVNHVSRRFRERFPNHVLLNDEAVEGYKRTAAFRVPVAVLAPLTLAWLLTFPVAYARWLFGAAPAGPGLVDRLVAHVAAAGADWAAEPLLVYLAALCAIIATFDTLVCARHTALKPPAFVEKTGQRTLIVGAGAIGGITGAYLSLAGEDIFLIDVNAAHVTAMKGRGLEISGARGPLRVRVRAAASTEALAELLREATGEAAPLFDVVLVAVKSAATEAALRPILRFTGPETVFVTVQNSINDDAIGAVVGFDRVVHGVTWWGGTFLGPGRLEQTSIGGFTVGELGDVKQTARVERVRRLLGRFGHTEISHSVRTDAWNKLLLNGVMNTFGLVFGERCAVLFNRPEILPIVLATLSEEVAVAKRVVGRLGDLKKLDMDAFLLSPRTPEKTVREKALALKIVSTLGGRIKSSMLQDQERGVRSENEHLLGLIRSVNAGSEVTPGSGPVPTPFIDRAHELAGRIDDGELAPGLENVRRFDDLVAGLPPYWRDPAHFALDGMGDRLFVAALGWLSRTFSPDY